MLPAVRRLLKMSRLWLSVYVDSDNFPVYDTTLLISNMHDIYKRFEHRLKSPILLEKRAN
jgi:hypothetical protein